VIAVHGLKPMMAQRAHGKKSIPSGKTKAGYTKFSMQANPSGQGCLELTLPKVKWLNSRKFWQRQVIYLNSAIGSFK
jgi:hypothetical protein